MQFSEVFRLERDEGPLICVLDAIFLVIREKIVALFLISALALAKLFPVITPDFDIFIVRAAARNLRGFLCHPYQGF